MAPIPKTMNGILVEKTGGTEVLQYKTDLQVPTPKEGEILVKNSIIGINYIDTYFRSGLYQAPKPEILGKEGAGKIIAIGPGVSGFVENDSVVWMGSSGYAEYSAAPASRTVKIPEAITESDACAAMLQALTALTLTEESYAVQKGDWILVLAASGGVGTWLCQILRAKGAHTIATVGSRAKAQMPQDMGAEVVLVEDEEGDDGVKKAIMEKTGGLGVQCVFDGVGKATFDRSLDVLARKGTLASFGNASGAVPPFAISPTLFNYVSTREEIMTYTGRLFTMMTEEKFDVKIHKIYPLKDVAQAHNDLEGRKTMGKLLLAP
ncbi:MAG: NADPH:quinone reductase [Ramalina farinacea]|uniref:NADPH:quinone reductase n=1 Tax=Ramalina farinacea TaxID=258253 RepID=A0AA43TTM5_9LECA|nr:NADPH:quinone reductase [Ramalina farinacea]